MGPSEAATKWSFSAWPCYSDAFHHLKIAYFGLKSISLLPVKMEILLKKEAIVLWLPLPHQPYYGLGLRRVHTLCLIFTQAPCPPTIFTVSLFVETSWQPAELHISRNVRWWHQGRIEKAGRKPTRCQESYSCYFNDFLPKSSERRDIIH